MSINYERHGKVAVFTIDNPKVNAFTPAMHKEFHDHLQSFLSDPDIHVGILTGAGSRAFCGGDDIKNQWSHGSLRADMDAHFQSSAATAADCRPGWERETGLMDRYKPIIGALNGTAMGMGTFYVLTHTDIRIAVPEAKLGLPEIAYGMGGAGGLAQVGRHLPRAVAMYMLLTGEPITAQEALSYHLINEIVEPDQLMVRAMEIAEKIASHPPLAVRVEMEAFNWGMELPRRDAVAHTTHLYRLQRATHLLDPDNTATPLAG